MIHETNLTNVEKDDLIFHFVPEIGENNDTLGDDVKEYVNQFLTKLCVEYETKPNTILGNDNLFQPLHCQSHEIVFQWS